MRRVLALGVVLATLGCKDGKPAAPTASAAGDAAPAVAAAGDAAPVAAAPLPPPLGAMGELATATTVTASASVAGERGGAVPLADGAMLVVTPGAYSGAVSLKLSRVDLSLGRLRADVKGGVAYVLDTDRDVASFGAPVTLQVKRPEGPLSAVMWDGSHWQPITVGDGPVATITIPHFSRGFFGFIEWLRARTNATDEAILEGDSVEAKKRARLLSDGNDAAKTFYGVGDKLESVNPRQLCGELVRLVKGMDKDSFGFPPGIDVGNMDLGLWLVDGRIPSTTNDPIWKMTEGLMEPIRQKFLASPGRLAPADMLQICIDQSGGNVPVGVLACHNFLKEVTYAGRNQPVDKMPAGYGEVVNKIMPWRTDDVAPSGYYDKMGPIYHIFAAMTAGTWSAHPVLGNAASAGESVLRTIQRGGDKPDPEKGTADDCGVDTGWFIRKHEATPWKGNPLPPPPPAPWKVDEPAQPYWKPTLDAGIPKTEAADAGPAADGGSPESMLASLDAGPAPADQRKGWNGTWVGTAKSSATLDGKSYPSTEAITLVATSTSDTVTLTRTMGKQTLSMELKKTPSNPNAAVGQGDKTDTTGVAQTTLHYHVACFLHTDGRLYVAGRTNVDSVMQGPDGPVHSHMMIEYIAILSLQ